MIDLIKSFKNYKIELTAIKMGHDWNISIYGGDRPHIGALALGIPRTSLEDSNKISSTVSVLTITGHKEDLIVQKAAKLLAKNLNSTVIVSCGVHIPNITLDEINGIQNTIDKLLDEFLYKIKHQATLI